MTRKLKKLGITWMKEAHDTRRGDAEGAMRRTLGLITAPVWLERDPDRFRALVVPAKAAPTHATVFMAQLHALMNSEVDPQDQRADARRPRLRRQASNGRELANRIPGAQLAMTTSVFCAELRRVAA